MVHDFASCVKTVPLKTLGGVTEKCLHYGFGIVFLNSDNVLALIEPKWSTNGLSCLGGRYGTLLIPIS